MLATSNNSLLLLSEGELSSSKVESLKLVKKPSKLIKKAGRDFIVLYDEGYISQLSLCKSDLIADGVTLVGVTSVDK